MVIAQIGFCLFFQSVLIIFIFFVTHLFLTSFLIYEHKLVFSHSSNPVMQHVQKHSFLIFSPLDKASQRLLSLLLFFLFLVVLGLCCCPWAFSCCGERDYYSLQCKGFSLRWLLLLQSMGSRHLRSVAQWCMGLVALQYMESSWTRD